MEELVISKKVYLSASSPALAVLLIQHGLQACAGLHKTLGRRTTPAGLLPQAAPAGYQQWQHLPVPDFMQKGSKMLREHPFCLTAEIMNTATLIQGIPTVKGVHSSPGQGLDSGYTACIRGLLRAAQLRNFSI